jgi:MFS family permease
MVTQVLIISVQNGVDRRDLGIATAATGFFRGLGGAVGAAVLGAVFAATAGSHVGEGAVRGLGSTSRSDIVAGVQAVFLVAAPLVALALLIVLGLPERPLAQASPAGQQSGGDSPRTARMRGSSPPSGEST